MVIATEGDRTAVVDISGDIVRTFTQEEVDEAVREYNERKEAEVAEPAPLPTVEQVMARYQFRIKHIKRIAKLGENPDLDELFRIYAFTVGMRPEDFDELPVEIIGEITERVQADAQRLMGKVESLNLKGVN